VDAKLQVKIGDFNAAMREMRLRVGNAATMQQIIDYEVAKILEKAVQKTDTATASSIRRSMGDKEWTTMDGKKYKLANRYPNGVWSSINAKMKASLKRKLAARGLAKQSFYALGLRMGFDIQVPGFVKEAKTPKHVNAENVNVERISRQGEYGLIIENHSPILRWAEGKQAFFSALAGRIGFFRANVKRGVFDSMASVAKKYPGLLVS